MFGGLQFHDYPTFVLTNHKGCIGKSTSVTNIALGMVQLDLVRPNPLQARRVLPDRVSPEFHGERVTPSQALREIAELHERVLSPEAVAAKKQIIRELTARARRGGLVDEVPFATKNW